VGAAQWACNVVLLGFLRSFILCNATVFKYGVKIGRVLWIGSLSDLYRLPGDILISFSTGLGKHTALIISDGLLHALDGRELVAVLAHLNDSHGEIRLPQ